MEEFFEIGKEYNPKSDQVMNLINDILSTNLDYPSGFVFLPLEDVENIDRNTAGEILSDPANQTWGLLKKERESQFKELELVINKLLEFYTTRWDYSTFSKEGYTPQEITYFLNRLLIRLNRLMCVLNPQYSYTTSKKKGTSRSYDMVKAYWINDAGQKVRSFTKNLGNSETAMIELPERLVSEFEKDAVVYQPVLQNGFRPDLVVAVGDKKWVVETKILDKEDYGRTFVIFELWKKYKETYALYS